jgi:hypothetical protein
MPNIKVFTIFDGALLFLLLAGGIAAIPLLGRYGPQTVAVYRDNRLIGEYPLSTDRTIRIQGELSAMVIGIRKSKVSVDSSGCPQQICVRSGSIAAPFQQLVCAPNHVLLEIHSGKTDARFDAITE